MTCHGDFFWPIMGMEFQYWPHHTFLRQTLTGISDWLCLDLPTVRIRINTKICLWYTNLMVGMQKKSGNIFNNYVSVCPIWFQGPILKMASTKPEWYQYPIRCIMYGKTVHCFASMRWGQDTHITLKFGSHLLRKCCPDDCQTAELSDYSKHQFYGENI